VSNEHIHIITYTYNFQEAFCLHTLRCTQSQVEPLILRACTPASAYASHHLVAKRVAAIASDRREQVMRGKTQNKINCTAGGAYR